MNNSVALPFDLIETFLRVFFRKLVQVLVNPKPHGGCKGQRQRSTLSGFKV